MVKKQRRSIADILDEPGKVFSDLDSEDEAAALAQLESLMELDDEPDLNVENADDDMPQLEEVKD